jgi:ABC-type phosphate transport system auxiliary subunit
MGERYTRLSKFGTSGDELIRIKAALNLTDDLQDVATKREQAEMYKQVEGFVGAFDFTMKNLRLLKERYQQPAEIS